MLERWPPLARWALLYVAVVAACVAVGYPTPLGVGNALFLAGAAALLWSLTSIRLGGPKALTGRDARGRPVYGDDPPARRAEIRRGLAAFAFAMALWAPLLAKIAWGA
jgi:hypothetical protein